MEIREIFNELKKLIEKTEYTKEDIATIKLLEKVIQKNKEYSRQESYTRLKFLNDSKSKIKTADIEYQAKYQALKKAKIARSIALIILGLACFVSYTAIGLLSFIIYIATFYGIERLKEEIQHIPQNLSLSENEEFNCKVAEERLTLYNSYEALLSILNSRITNSTPEKINSFQELDNAYQNLETLFANFQEPSPQKLQLQAKQSLQKIPSRD